MILLFSPPHFFKQLSPAAHDPDVPKGPPQRSFAPLAQIGQHPHASKIKDGNGYMYVF